MTKYTDDEILEIFQKTGALKKGHFLLTSGLHSPVYWEKFRVLQYPLYTSILCKLIAEHFASQNVDMVVGPTTGGVILAFEVARQMNVITAFAEKTEEGRVFRRDFTVQPDSRILIVDDVMTTGGSIWDTKEAVEKLKGLVIGIGILVDRSGKGIDFGVPLFSCIKTEAVTYKAEDCPLCTQNVPLEKPGSQS